MRSRSSKTIVVIADTHVGNINAVCTPEAARRIPHRHKRALAKQFYEGWQWCKDQLTKKEIDLLILNGDMIDGSNYKDLGSEVWTTSMSQQVDDAVELFKEYRYRNVIVTTGSGYHVKRGNDQFEDILSERLLRYETDGRASRELRSGVLQKTNTKEGWERDPGGHVSRYTDYNWDFELFDHTFSITHHVGGSTVPMYRATPLQKEMYNTALDALKLNDTGKKPSFIIRSHTHHYIEVRDGSTFGIITPAWKMPDQFLHNRGTGGLAPSIGIVEIALETNGKRDMYPYLLQGLKYPKKRIPNITPYL